MKKFAVALVCALSCGSFVSARTMGRIPVLIVDGESAAPYHNWAAISPVLKRELEEVGLFDVDVLTAPPKGSDFSSFHPDWSRYRVVVFNYDAPDERWPESAKQSFEAYIRDGGGLVTVHAADNAFPNWQVYNEMIGVGGWRDRDENSGPHWIWKDGKLAADETPGKAGQHGLRIPFLVTARDTTHPIMRGLPKTWMHQGDELYANLRGPGKMTVLATAYSDPANHGTGYDEPMVMVSQFGKGRVFHMTWGHDVIALSSTDAVVLFQRGVEWAATGKVTQAVPASFPTATTVSYRADLAAMDPNAKKGLNVFDSTGRPARQPAKRAGPPPP